LIEVFLMWRGCAAAEAGAEAVLMQSKQRSSEEIVAFCNLQLSFREVGQLGMVGMVICGNRAVRAAVAGTRKTFKCILEDRGTAGVERDIASVADTFNYKVMPI
jgi:2-methylisocitrate lyase-like PEP mutase family enzyme